MTIVDGPKRVERIHSLDALRGIAAAIVVLSHVAKCYQGYDDPSPTR